MLASLETEEFSTKKKKKKPEEEDLGKPCAWFYYRDREKQFKSRNINGQRNEKRKDRGKTILLKKSFA